MMLPTFRRKILQSFLQIVALFGTFGLFMLFLLGATGSIAPNLVHLNYDSIAAADEMREAWNALRFPADYPHLPQATATIQFDRALALLESNETEAGEPGLATSIRSLWNEARQSPVTVTRANFLTMHQLLGQVVTLNEKGMFDRVARAKRLSRVALAASGCILLVMLVLAVYLSDSLATRLAQPIKGIAEALHARPGVSGTLRLPTPTTIELRILIREMRRLWDSVSEANKVNIARILQQKSKLETLVSSVEDAFLVLDERRVVTQCNGLMARLIGVPVEQIVDTPWEDLPSASDNYLKLRELLHEAGDREAEVELPLDGRKHNFTIRSRRIIGPTEETAGSLVLLRDVTDKRQRDRLRSELMDLLSHELKTPVQSLGIAADMLARHKAEIGDKLGFFIDTINEDVARIRAVAQQFLQATQTQARSLRLDLKRVPLSDALRQWLKPFEVLADAKGVHLDYKVDGSGPIWAAVDPIKFPWAISNLLSNAIRVSAPGSTVGVAVTQRDGRTSVDVVDDGPGVPEAVQRRMYEPFYQGPQDGGEPVERGLLGVGLTIAKEVVEGHEGTLEYVRRQPRGSLFRIILPTPNAMDG